MFELPSSGSKTTAYFGPWRNTSETTIISSFSSETMTATLPEDWRELMKMSLLITSSFLTSSPWTFVFPASPVLVVGGWLVGDSQGTPSTPSTWSTRNTRHTRNTHRLTSPARRTELATNLHPSCMDTSSSVKSPFASGCFRWSARTWRERVMSSVGSAMAMQREEGKEEEEAGKAKGCLGEASVSRSVPMAKVYNRNLIGRNNHKSSTSHIAAPIKAGRRLAFSRNLTEFGGAVQST